MLTESEKTELERVVNQSLDRAEQQWSNTMLREGIIKAAAETPTNIPGHPFLGKNKYTSDTFIAMMLDMRNSREHLMCATATNGGRTPDRMQRVYYEVSALLPCMATIVEKDRNGSVIEYLGDGFLALFRMPKDNKDLQDDEIGNVGYISRKCLAALHSVVNPIINKRYWLPPIQIGIGLACSEAIITHFGIEASSQVKVIGQCIYYASHLSKGVNEIIIQDYLERIWPTTEGGKLRFQQKKVKDINGYLLVA